MKLVFLSLVFIILSSNHTLAQRFVVKSDKKLIKEALALFKQNKFIESIIIWKSLHQKYPENTLYTYNIASIYYKLDQFKKAIQFFQEVIDKNGNLSDAAKYYIALSYHQVGKSEQGNEVLQELVQNPNTNKKIQLSAKDFLHNKENKIIQTDSDSVPLEYLIALKYFKRQQYKNALLNLLIAENYINTPEYYLIRGITHYKLEQYRPAQEYLNRVLDTSRDMLLRKNARQILAYIKYKKNKGFSRTQWQLFYDSSLNYTTNPLNISSIDSDTKNSQFTNLLRVAYQNKFNDSFFTTPSYGVTYNVVVDDPKDTFLEHRVEFMNQFFFQNFALTLTPKLIKQYSLGHEYLDKYGGKLTYSHQLDKVYSWGIQYNLINNKAPKDEFDYLDAHTNYIKLFLNTRTSKYNFNFSILSTEESYNDSDTLILTNKGVGSSIVLTIYPGQKSSVYTAISYLQQIFDRNPSLDDFQVIHNLSFSLGLNYQVANSLFFYANIQTNFIDKKIDSNSFSQEVSTSEKVFTFEDYTTLGFNWSF